MRAGYQVGQKVLVRESRYQKEPWTITPVHTNGTISAQCNNKSERMNIWKLKPFETNE
jgi:hypothetical protein